MRSLLKKMVNVLLAGYVLVLVLGLILILQTLLPIMSAHGVGFKDVLFSSNVDLAPIAEDVKNAMETQMPDYAKKIVVLAFDN